MNCPDDAGAMWPVQAYVQTVLPPGSEDRLVVSWRRMQFLFRVDVADVNQLAVGQ